MKWCTYCMIGIIIFSSLMMLTNLGDRMAWVDEAETSFFATTTLESSIPITTNSNGNVWWVNADGSKRYENFPKLEGRKGFLQALLFTSILSIALIGTIISITYLLITELFNTNGSAK